MAIKDILFDPMLFVCPVVNSCVVRIQIVIFAAWELFENTTLQMLELEEPD